MAYQIKLRACGVQQNFLTRISGACAAGQEAQVSVLLRRACAASHPGQHLIELVKDQSIDAPQAQNGSSLWAKIQRCLAPRLHDEGLDLPEEDQHASQQLAEGPHA